MTNFIETNRQRSQDFSYASIPIVVIQHIVYITGDLLFGHEEGNISRIPALFHCHRSAHFHSVRTGLYRLQVARPSYTIFLHNREESQTSPQPVNVNTNRMSMSTKFSYNLSHFFIRRVQGSWQVVLSSNILPEPTTKCCE